MNDFFKALIEEEKLLKKLKQLNLLTGAKGEFIINPKVFWKGTNDARNTLIKEGKLTLSFEFDFEVEDENTN